MHVEGGEDSRLGEIGRFTHLASCVILRRDRNGAIPSRLATVLGNNLVDDVPGRSGFRGI